MFLLRRAQVFAAPSARLLSTVVPTLPYRVVRNSRGSLPIFTDLKKGGSQYFVLVRNIEGDANALLQDLRATLFPEGSEGAALFSGEVIRSKHLKLRAPGRNWRLTLKDWLEQRGF